MYIHLRDRTRFFAPRRNAARETYIGHIDVEQVEQHAFLSRNRGISAGLRAQLKWSKWSARAMDYPLSAGDFHP
jgi:hypothetical protein